VPLLIGTSVAKAVAALRARQDTADASADGGDGAAGPSRPQPVTLDWRSLSCRLTNEKTGASKQLLSLAGGSAVPGRLLAIMGPSGSGATAAHERPYQSSLSATSIAPCDVSAMRWRYCRLHAVRNDGFLQHPGRNTLVPAWWVSKLSCCGSASDAVQPERHPMIAGKTTLLNILAGQLPQNAQLTLSGVITVNGVPIERSSHGQGYVQQEDIFYSQLTVKRVLRLLPACTPNELMLLTVLHYCLVMQA